MKILSWNVNGLRAVERKWHIPDLHLLDMDMIFMQEIKAKSDQLSDELNHPTPYKAIYHSAEKAWYSWVGLWIHNRIASQVVWVDHDLPGNPVENEWRIIHAVLNLDVGITHIYGIYFPNGGKSEEAWQHKLAVYECLTTQINIYKARGEHVIWWGDINCAHHAIDLARPKENDGKIGFHPLERAWLDRMGELGHQDIWRVANPTISDMYSWWDPVTKSRERNVWWRIDAWWADESFCTQTQPRVTYLTQMMGSDHCPILMEW